MNIKIKWKSTRLSFIHNWIANCSATEHDPVANFRNRSMAIEASPPILIDTAGKWIGQQCIVLLGKEPFEEEDKHFGAPVDLPCL